MECIKSRASSAKVRTTAVAFALSALVATVALAAVGPDANATQGVTKGLVSLYTFNEGSGTVVRDVSGVGAPTNLRIIAPSATKWVRGGLDVVRPTLIASNGAATKITSAVKVTGQITVEAWVKPATNVQRGPARIVALAGGATGTNQALIQGTRTGGAAPTYTARIRTTQTAKWGSTLETPKIAQTKLTHVLFTRDVRGVHKLYVDGVLRSQNTIPGDLRNWDSSYRLALAGEFGRNRSWLGGFRLVAVYSRALSAAEVKTNLTAGPERKAPGKSAGAVTSTPTAPAKEAPSTRKIAPPAAPKLSVSNPGSKSVAIGVVAPRGVSSVRIGWTEAGTGRSWNGVYKVGNVPATLTGLVPGTSYDVYARSVTASGVQGPAVRVKAKTAPAAGAPAQQATAPQAPPATAEAPPPAVAAATGGAHGTKLPARVVGGYWPYWNGPKLSTIPKTFNTIYLFSARPVGGQPGSTGAVFWEQGRQSAQSFRDDLAAIRAEGRAVILSICGAGEYLRLDTRARTTAFVNSVKQIYADLGGFDGLDWNIESTEVWPDEMVWASQQLKAAFGSSFAITYPPAPWRQEDRAVARALAGAGMLDLVAPQYYDLTGLASEQAKRDHAIENVRSVWLPIVGGDASKVGVGFKNVGASTETMTIDTSVSVWNALSAATPGLRGGFVWEISADAGIGYAFANQVGAAISR